MSLTVGALRWDGHGTLGWPWDGLLFCAIWCLQLLPHHTPPTLSLEHLWAALHIRTNFSKYDSFKDTALTTMLLFIAKKSAHRFSPSAGGTFTSVGIGHAPTLFGVRNLKGRNIRPYPIKLGRICMHRGEIRARYGQLSCHLVETESHTDRDTSHTSALPLGRDVLHKTQPHSTRGQALDDSPSIEWTLSREPLCCPALAICFHHKRGDGSNSDPVGSWRLAPGDNAEGIISPSRIPGSAIYIYR